jgi:hypothetical protein
MPRKQRFKPSRKPQMPSASPQVDDRQEIPPSDGPSQGRDAMASGQNSEPEGSR